MKPSVCLRPSPPKKEVTNGREGGLMIDGYNDIKMDDVIEAYVMEEIKR
ncbi:translation initiation factor IF-2 [Streptococcus pneumoniae]|nr:translation initiation factor IF-2 [Streptococcus pneumoniae]